jgi:hypothetical protein
MGAGRTGLAWRQARLGLANSHSLAYNKGMELTAYSVRCAPASGSSSCLAFGFLPDSPLRPAVSALESASSMGRIDHADENR